MKTSSCKAKSRVLQDKIREMYRDVGRQYGLQDDDVKATPMGQSGVDILFSPAARAVFNHSIECKKHAAVRIPYFFKEHYKKYENDSTLKLLFSENNRDQTLVTMRAEDFMFLIEELLNLQQKDA
jgi:hypothetical protein